MTTTNKTAPGYGGQASLSPTHHPDVLPFTGLNLVPVILVIVVLVIIALLLRKLR